MTIRRKIDGPCTEDPGAIDNIEYNSYSGGKKHIEVGPALKYVGVTTAEVVVQAGDQLFFYKTTVGTGFVIMSEVTGVAAPGVVPAADTFPIHGQELTALSAAEYKFIRGTADIHLYILKDDNQVRVNP